jgi:hypothetical protein
MIMIPHFEDRPAMDHLLKDYLRTCKEIKTLVEQDRSEESEELIARFSAWTWKMLASFSWSGDSKHTYEIADFLCLLEWHLCDIKEAA